MSTLTSYVCENARWPGILVNGTSTADQSPLIGGDQGYLHLSASTVSNAMVGAQTTTYLPGGGVDQNGTGGIIITAQSTFKNCRVGVEINPYHMHFSNGVENNVCRFSYTDFVTDEDWPDALLPQWHARVRGTRKVDLFYCNFRNDDGASYTFQQRGNGLLASSAEVRVLGGSSAANGSFQNLTHGFYRAGDPTVPSTVDHMHLLFNHRGVVDLGGNWGRYVNNTFLVPDQTLPEDASVGMYLWQPHLFTVERNAFTGLPARANSVGIFFLGINPDLPTWDYEHNEIYDNTFTSLHTGCLANDVHRSQDGTANDRGLSLYCGDYTNNVYDIALADQTPIQPNQFELPGQLVGNRYFDADNCSSEHDWILDDNWNVNEGSSFNEMVITHRRHLPQVCEAFCPDEEDDFFADIPDANFPSFDKSIHCANGSLDMGHNLTQAQEAYVSAKALNVSAKELLDGATDGGDQPDLLLELAKQPWLGSAFLRDRLVLNSPLSNKVLEAMIDRGQPMDMWHITQVCVENAPLDPGVWNKLRDANILDDFFLNVVLQAQNGENPGLKNVLQDEWMQRRGQQAKAFAAVGFLWATDTLNIGSEDSLRNALANHPGLNHRWVRMARQLAAGDASAAEAELANFEPGQNGDAHLRAVIGMADGHEGDWSALTEAEKDTLASYALANQQGAPHYAGLLATYAGEDVMLHPRFPMKSKRAGAVSVSDAHSPIAGISTFPTPADAEAMLVFPAAWNGELFSVGDAQGRVVLQGRLESAGVHRLPTAQLANGTYTIRVGGAIGRMVIQH